MLGRGDLVVDAPADVLRPRLAAVRPPGVLLGLVVRAGGTRPRSRARRTRASARRAPRAGSRSSCGCERQFLRSISLCAMFQSPHRMISRPLSASSSRCGRNTLMKRNLDAWRCGAGRARGQVDRDHRELAEARLEIAALGVDLAAAEALARPRSGVAPAVQRDAAVALLLRERVAGLEHLQAVQLRRRGRPPGTSSPAGTPRRRAGRRASGTALCLPPSGCR